jgi:hypothetical protein
MVKQNISKRYRVNVSRTATGKTSYDCTVEMENLPMDLVLQESDELVAKLDKRYPAPTV